MSQSLHAVGVSSTDHPYSRLIRPDGLVHRSLFTDPKIFDDEMIKIFGGSWVFLLHEAEIPRPDDFKTITVGRRPTIVTRAAEGTIHALLNRCTHRASMICAAEYGNAKRFQCPYHGWTFSNTGQVVAVTHPSGYGEAFHARSHDLGKFPRVESYRGYVFGSLNPEVEPLSDWLGPAREVFDWAVEKDDIGPSGVRVVKGTHMTYRGNWKHQNDNNCDAYHAPFGHQSTAKMNQRRYGAGKGLDHFKGEDTPMVVQYLGHGHKLLDQRPAIGSPWMRARPVPGRETLSAAVIDRLGEAEAGSYLDLTGRSGINLVLYPNLLMLGHGSFAVYEPMAYNLTNVKYYTVLLNDAPDEVNNLRIRFNEDFNTVGHRDDTEIFERTQPALEYIPEMEWLDFSRGLGTDREREGPDGVITGNVTDETGIRGSYARWLELMTSGVHPRIA